MFLAIGMGCLRILEALELSDFHVDFLSDEIVDGSPFSVPFLLMVINLEFRMRLSFYAIPRGGSSRLLRLLVAFLLDERLEAIEAIISRIAFAFRTAVVELERRRIEVCAPGGFPDAVTRLVVLDVFMQEVRLHGIVMAAPLIQEDEVLDALDVSHALVFAILLRRMSRPILMLDYQIYAEKLAHAHMVQVKKFSVNAM